MMYRVLAIVGGALALGACSSSSGFMDALKPSPSLDSVRLESEPPGAEAKAANGQSCRTPCALALPVDGPIAITFTLNGYQPETETVEPVSATGSPTQLRPNPVTVELTAAAPQAAKRSGPRKRTPRAAKPAAAKRPAAAVAAPAAAPAPAPAPAAQQPAPWPSSPPAR